MKNALVQWNYYLCNGMRLLEQPHQQYQPHKDSLHTHQGKPSGLPLVNSPFSDLSRRGLSLRSGTIAFRWETFYPNLVLAL